jgi:HEAT repeat protein
MCLALTACAEKEVEDLVDRLRTRDAQELRQVTGRIARLPNALAVPALRKGLHAGKWRTRYMSAKLLGRFQAQEAIPELIDALDDSIGGVRVQAAGALGALQAQGAVPRLIDLLDSDNEVVQIGAADALGLISSPAALPALGRLSESVAMSVRAAAISALGLCQDYTSAPQQSADALRRTRRALDDVFVGIRIAGIVSLRGFDYRGSVDDLLRLLRDPSAEVQHVAVQALGEITSVDQAAWQGHATPDMRLITDALDSIATATTNVAVRTRALQSLATIAEASATIP